MNFDNQTNHQSQTASLQANMSCAGESQKNSDSRAALWYILYACWQKLKQRFCLHGEKKKKDLEANILVSNMPKTNWISKFKHLT